MESNRQLAEAQDHLEDCERRALDQERKVKHLINTGAPHADAVTLLRLLQDALQLAEINRDIQEIVALAIEDAELRLN